MSLVNRLRELCVAKGVSFNQFEKESGVGRGTAAKWDTNSPSIDKVSKAAEYFNVSVSCLIGEQNEKPTLISESEPDAETIQLKKIWDSADQEERDALLAMAKMLKARRPK